MKAAIIKMAQAAQGQGDYPGVDDFRVVILKKGTKIYGGAPGQSAFFTTARTLDKYGNDAANIFGALQVKLREYDPTTFDYRPGMTEYLLKEDVPVAIGITRANPQWGPGGATQIFVEDYKSVLEPAKSILLSNWRFAK
jgi:hypothetical protein